MTLSPVKRAVALDKWFHVALDLRTDFECQATLSRVSKSTLENGGLVGRGNLFVAHRLINDNEGED